MTKIVLPQVEIAATIREALRMALIEDGLLLVRPDPPGQALPGVLALRNGDLDTTLVQLSRRAGRALTELAFAGPSSDRPVTIERELAIRPFVQAFERGFAIGADARADAERIVVNANMHSHSRCGFEAGRSGLRVALAAYRREVLR